MTPAREAQLRDLVADGGDAAASWSSGGMPSYRRPKLSDFSRASLCGLVVVAAATASRGADEDGQGGRRGWQLFERIDRLER